MKHICTTCNYIYNDSDGFEDEGIEMGRKFEDLDEDFVCPYCSSPKEYFHELSQEINYIGGEGVFNEKEAQHIPVYEISGDMVKVVPGLDTHPQAEEHYIKSVSLYDEYGDEVYTSNYKPGDEIEFEFDVSDLDDFEIRLECNLDGIWSTGIINKCEEN